MSFRAASHKLILDAPVMEFDLCFLTVLEARPNLVLSAGQIDYFHM